MAPGTEGAPDVRGLELDAHDPLSVCRALSAPDGPALLLGGRAGGSGWCTGTLLALHPRPIFSADVSRAAEVGPALDRLDSLVRERRRAGGPAETGLAVLLSYDLLDPEPVAAHTPRAPRVLVLAVDAALQFREDGGSVCFGGARLTVRGGPGGQATLDSASRLAEAIRRGLDAERVRAPRAPVPRAPAPARDTAPRTTLPRHDYLSAVRRVQEHIGAGDIYQGNLCQQFRTPFPGDPLDLYERLLAATAAPRAAYVATPRVRLVSASPECFVRADPSGRIETWPIKGTRPRGATAEQDRRAADDLLGSEKDRAELLMIVDLERNDLGRLCRTGSVRVPELARLTTFPTVHHLVARVEGELGRPVAETGAATLVRALFPGGSITGAPKLRAIEILRGLEPARRGLFTGSLCWFGDDGTFDSSILIRSIEVADGTAWLGAGGGIVADSDPEAEWHESNHKARALAAVLGFDPEEAR